MMVCLLVAASAAFGQSNTIKGKLDIQFNSRVQQDDNGNPTLGVKDVYTFDLGVTDTLLFQGSVEHLPTILGGGMGSEKQAGTLMYNLNLVMRNPAYPEQKKAVGKFVGGVPIDKKGVYQYGNGTMRMAVDVSGKASGFESAFRGTAAGKPPKGSGSSLIERAKKKAETLTRQVKGKTVRLVVTDYDKMAYPDLVIAAGPVQAAYPETRVTGEMMYDYERSSWYFRNVTMAYTLGGKSITDKLTGNIKWVESPQRKSNGEGQYEFDVRVNEPEQQSTEAAVFQPADDEAAFFTPDKTLSCLTGTAKYKDVMRGDTVSSSAVNIELVGNNLSKAQMVYLAKLIWLVNVVPMNAE